MWMLFTYTYDFIGLTFQKQLSKIVNVIKKDMVPKVEGNSTICDKINYLCVLSPKSANYIFKNILLDMLNGENIIENKSFLVVDDIGKKTNGKITIRDDPTLARVLNSYYIESEVFIAKERFV